MMLRKTPATTTLIAYAQYDNLVVVDAYRAVTFDYNVWCFGWQLLEAQKRERLAARALVGAYTFAYNEAQIRCLLRWHTHAYIQRRRPLIVSRSPVYIGRIVNASTIFFLAMETPTSSWSAPFWPLGSSRLDAWPPSAWSMMTCQKLATTLATLVLLTFCSDSWTANQRPGNTTVRLLCGASLMQVVLYSIAPKDNLHHTSVFPLTFSAGRTSLYHQQQWIPLMTRTVLVKAAAGALPWLYLIIWMQDLSSILGAECAPVSKEKLAMYFHGQESHWRVFTLDQPWLN